MDNKQIFKYFKSTIIFGFLGAFFFFIFFFLLFRGFWIYSDSRIIYSNVLVEKSSGYNITNEILKVVKNVSDSHNWTEYVYDCKNFSRDLVEQLSWINISAYCVIGDSDGAHEWVETIIDNKIIPIEATGGFFIRNNTYLQDYTIYTKGICM